MTKRQAQHLIECLDGSDCPPGFESGAWQLMLSLSVNPMHPASPATHLHSSTLSRGTVAPQDSSEYKSFNSIKLIVVVLYSTALSLYIYIYTSLEPYTKIPKIRITGNLERPVNLRRPSPQSPKDHGLIPCNHHSRIRAFRVYIGLIGLLGFI